jgi:hypothetical protein
MARKLIIAVALILSLLAGLVTAGAASAQAGSRNVPAVRVAAIHNNMDKKVDD